jgi:DNA-directed RNA polymerase subunit M/transcription elongation factor TFIIS
VHTLLGIPEWVELVIELGYCERCNNYMRYSRHKLGQYFVCSPCYYMMSKDQRESFASEVRDWDLIRKDRDYQDLD